MKIEPGVGVGKIRFGMTRGQVLDLLTEDKVVIEYNRMTTKKYRFLFDQENKLKYLSINQPGDEEINGIKIGTSLFKASELLKCVPKFNHECTTYFDALPGIWFNLSQANDDYLYETGAYENEILDNDSYDLKKLKIKYISFGVNN